jgi:aryl-alcohol dehydrogenase-like predicted oxidoreductase
MERRRLGQSALEVPVIGMGTWKTFDVRDEKEEKYRNAIVDAALKAGANFFDSSPMYGEAERVLGNSIEELGIRDKVMVATKIWTQSDEDSQKQIDFSLSCFGGYIDLYQVHNLVRWQKRLEQLEELKAAGKVKAIGITHYQHSAFTDMMTLMKSGRVEVIQIPYNALDRIAEEAILPLAAELNIGVIIMRPLGVGDLVKQSPTTEELKPFERFGIKTWPQVLLKWILSDKRVHIAIPATSKADRMAENAAAGDGPLFDEATREEVCRLAKKYR